MLGLTAYVVVPRFLFRDRIYFTDHCPHRLQQRGDVFSFQSRHSLMSRLEEVKTINSAKCAISS